MNRTRIWAGIRHQGCCMYFKDNVLIIWKISKNVLRKKWLRGTGREGEKAEKDLQM